MTISYVCERFVKGNPIKGAYMGVEVVDGREILYHRWSRVNKGPIAEIVDRKDNGNFTLILHPYVNYGKTSHNNRIFGVLRAICAVNKNGDFTWSDMRYSSFVRYSVYVHDRKLDIEYQLKRPLKFNCTDGKLVIDYADLESHTVPEGEREVVVEPNDNNNIKNEMARLNTIITTV